MLAILLIILGLSFVVAIHEAAHMFTSKSFGVRVKTFALGFGPVLLSHKTKETSYELRLLPLGGFVQCDGEDPSSKVKRGFFSLPWWKRSLIALAGPLVNLAAGFLMLFGVSIAKGWPLLLGAKKALALCTMVIVETMKALFGPAIHASISNLSGPVGVTKVMAQAAHAGLAEFTTILAIISLSLGLFNLFPIPGLDGGHIFLYVLEGIYGKKFPKNVYLIWNFLGFVLLISLMLFTVYLDLSR